mmetsp:Transcript_76833/g.124309  ORF Transcript_76833/g.124309 Transcript_76833/m.124309 type:complete len:281 (-) Transcript_76833:435-1277(-)
MGKFVVDAEDRDAVVTAIGNEHEISCRVDTDSATGVHVPWKGVWNGSHRLHEAQSRFGTHGVAVTVGELLCQPTVELKHRDFGRELIHHVAHWQRRMELDVPRSQPTGTCLRRSGPQHASGGESARLWVVLELADHVHTQIRHISDAPEERVQDYRMGVRVSLALLLRRSVVVRVVHVLVSPCLHRAALVGVVDRAARSDHAGRVVHTKDSNGGVPVVHNQHVLALLVKCKVAGRGPARAFAAKHSQLTASRAHRPTDYVPWLGDRLSAGVQNVPARMSA